MARTIVLETISRLAGAGELSRSRHGILAVDEVVPAGHYTRRPATWIDAADLLSSQHVYHAYINLLAQSFDPIRRYVLSYAVLTGQGAVVTRGQSLVENSCYEFLAQGLVPPGLVTAERDQFRWQAYPTEWIGKPSLLLKRPWWRNYGHWLVDAAALLALLRSRGISGFEQIVIGAAAANPRLHALFLETLAILAPDVPVVEHPDDAVWAFDELHYVEPTSRPPMFKLPEALEALRAAVAAQAPSAATGRRLFVSRRHYKSRALANEAEIVSLCEDHGFEVVFPERLGLREQAALFGSAEMIIGAKGAGMANMIFMPPDASAVVLSPSDFADPFFWDIAGPRGLAYSEIFGPILTTTQGLGQNPFTIDAGRLRGFLHKTYPEPTVRRQAALPPQASADMAPGSVVNLRPETVADDDVVLPNLQGDPYRNCLELIHRRLRPRTYLEIGTLHGDTLVLSQSRSVAIDPAFQLKHQLPGTMPSLFLFQGTSDAFFETHDPKLLLKAPLDLAFLDGMHRFEVLLRDFINTERHCTRDSVIVMHDCIPLDLDMAGRDMAEVLSIDGLRHPGWWTGDVWKTVDLLMAHRPDLEIIAVDAPPTGLIIIRGLDPTSDYLSSRYAEFVEEYLARPDVPAFLGYIDRLKVLRTDCLEQIFPDGHVMTGTFDLL